MGEGRIGELLVGDVAVLEEAGDVGAQQRDRERLLDVAVSTHLEGLQTGFHAHGGGQQQHGQVAVLHVGLDVVAELAAVHQRHHDVADHEVDALFLQLLHRILSVGGGDDVVLVGQLAGQVGAHFGGVFDHQQRVAAAVEVGVAPLLRLRLLVLHADLLRLFDGQLQHEGIAVADGGVQVQLAVVQPGQGAGESQSESGALALALLADLIEYFEDFLALPRGNHGAVAVHAQDGSLAVGGRLQRQFDAVLRVFDGVGEQVADDFLHGVAGAHHLERLVGNILLQGDLLLLGHLLEITAGLADDGAEVLLEEDGLDFVLLHLAQVEQLVGQAEQAVGVGLDGQQVLLGFRRIVVLVDQLVERHLDQGQRGADLVRDVGEEVDLGVVDLFLLLVLHLGEVTGAVALPFHLELVEEQGQQGEEEDDVNDLGGLAPEDGGFDVELQAPVGFGRLRTDDGHIEGIASRSQAGETGAVLRRRRGGQEFPRAAAEGPGIGDLPEDGIIGGGEADGQQGDVAGLDADALRAEGGPAVFMQADGAFGVARFDVRDEEGMVQRGLLDLARREDGQALGVAQEDVAAAGHERRAVGELRAHDLLLVLDIAPDPEGFPVEVHDAARGGHPQDAVFVLRHGAGHVVGETVGACQGMDPQVGEIGIGVRIAEAAALGGDPDAVPAVFVEGSDAVGREAAVGSHSQVREAVSAAVAAKEAVAIGADPQIAAAVLEEAVDEFVAGRFDGYETVLLGIQDEEIALAAGQEPSVRGPDAAAGRARHIILFPYAVADAVIAVHAAAEGMDPEIVAFSGDALHVEARHEFVALVAASVRRDGVQSAVLGAEPDVSVGIAGDGADDVADHRTLGRIGIEERERVLLVLPDVDTIIICTDPDVAVAVFFEAGDEVGREGVRVSIQVADMRELSGIQVLDEDAVVGADPVFARLALQDVYDLIALPVAERENVPDRQVEVDGPDEQHLPVGRGGEQQSVRSGLDVRQLPGEMGVLEVVPPLVVAVQAAIRHDGPHGVVGVDGEFAGETVAGGVGFDFLRGFVVAVDFVARKPDAAFLVRQEVETRAGAQPSDPLRRAGVGVIASHAFRGAEPDEPVFVLGDVHAGQGGDVVEGLRAGTAEIVTVETGQAVPRADPYEAEAVLEGAVDGIGGQTLVGRVVLKIIIRCSLGKAAGQTCKQQEGE